MLGPIMHGYCKLAIIRPSEQYGVDYANMGGHERKMHSKCVLEGVMASYDFECRIFQSAGLLISNDTMEGIRIIEGVQN